MPDVSLRMITENKPLFVTRWWGFRPSHWAAVAFHSEGTVERWIKTLPDGGYVLGFASHRVVEQVPEADRGRVFGVYQFIAEKVVYDDPTIIDPAYLEDPAMRRSDGGFRWPWGLRAVRAWAFKRTDIKTSGTLPVARSLSYEATTNMVAISTADFVQANQHLLHEVEVFNVPFSPMALRSPNAKPDRNYILICEDMEILKRIPGWRHGEILIKPGIASDFEGRMEFLNNHALARVFGLVLKQYFDEPAESPELASARESAMIARALELGCRKVGSGQEEFLFAKPNVMASIMLVGRPEN